MVLGVLIFVHELGHFLLAKLFGVRVLKFSLGFGNKLIGKKWGETEYLISAFPLGGYVKMFGEQPDEEVTTEERAVSFTHKTVWQRFGIVLAGPLFNLFFAVFLFWLMFTFAGLPGFVESGLVGKVSQDQSLNRQDCKTEISLYPLMAKRSRPGPRFPKQCEILKARNYRSWFNEIRKPSPSQQHQLWTR